MAGSVAGSGSGSRGTSTEAVSAGAPAVSADPTVGRWVRRISSLTTTRKPRAGIAANSHPAGVGSAKATCAAIWIPNATTSTTTGKVTRRGGRSPASCCCRSRWISKPATTAMPSMTTASAQASHPVWP